jgi:two-component system nitrogen regulation response regulator GlnG
VAPDAIRRLNNYPWPGNVRELQSVLKQALLRAHGSVLMSEFLPDLPPLAVSSAPPDSLPGTDFDALIRQRLHTGTTNIYAQVHLELDRLLLPLALQFTHGNQIHAAKLLGIARQTLRNRLRESGVSITKAVDTGESSEN